MSTEKVIRVSRSAFMVVDLANSTQWCLAHDDLIIQKLLCRLLIRISDCVIRSDGWVVKYLGDGLQAVFDNPSDAFAAAKKIQRLTIDMSEEQDIKYPRSRVGLSYGDCVTYQILEKIDCYGSAAILATRLSETGKGGEINMCGRFFECICRQRKVSTEEVSSHEYTLKGYEASAAYRVIEM